MDSWFKKKVVTVLRSTTVYVTREETVNCRVVVNCVDF